jgi:hypothetical protein
MFTPLYWAHAQQFHCGDVGDVNLRLGNGAVLLIPTSNIVSFDDVLY